MNREEKVHITFEIQINEDKYSYKPRGEAKADIEIPLFSINGLNCGNIFDGLLHVALMEYHKALEEENDSEEDE